MGIIEYLKALQPRRVIWFMVFALGGMSISGLLAYGASLVIGSSPATFHGSAAVNGSLVALLAIVFWSGYVAWDKERSKNKDKWPRIGTSQRIAIANALTPFETERQTEPEIRPFQTERETNDEISIFSYAGDDSAMLAVDLCDVVARATNGRVVPEPQQYPFPLPSGLRIDAPTDDARGLLLKKALEKELKIEVHLERRSKVGFLILIGMRA